MGSAGKVIYPMYQMNITSLTGGEVKLLKTYEKEGYYISGIEMEGFIIYLNRMQYNGSAYVMADTDMIMNREGDTNKTITVQKAQDSIKQAQMQFALKKNIGEEEPKLLTPQETVLETVREVAFDKAAIQSEYYVYAQGKVLLATDNMADAVIMANKTMGVVLNTNQQYVWKRARKTIQTAFKGMKVGDEDKHADSVTQSINAMLQWEGININVSALMEKGDTPQEILQNTLRDKLVLDLTGCTTDEVLFYVSNGAAVFAMTDTNTAALIIGYDAGNITIYDPVRNITYRKSIEDANIDFAKAGNIFFSYL